MKRLGVIMGMALCGFAGPPLAQDAPPLTCRDALEEIGRKTSDAYDLAAVARTVRAAFKSQEAKRADDGKQPIAAGWTPDTMTGEVMAIVLSCREHAGETLEKRTADTYRAYVIQHGP